MAGQALTKPPANGNGLAQRDPIQLAEHFAASGYFKDARDLSQAVVKIVAGEELGIGPMGAMQGIHLIDGKPSLSANLLASLVKRHPVYDYIPRDHTPERCVIEFFQNGESLGTSEFTIEEAKQAGVYRQNWQKYPKAMLFARALSQGVRWYCPDVTAGSPAYVPEELGAEVTQEGEPVQVEQTAPEPDAEPEEVDGELEPEWVDHIVDGFRVLGLTAGEIKQHIGAVGGEAPKINRADSIRKSLRELTQEQADQLSVALDTEAVAQANDNDEDANGAGDRGGR